MDKIEILNRLKASREIHTMDRSSKNWKDAFAAYKIARGEKLDMGCNKCYQKVLDWLQE